MSWLRWIWAYLFDCVHSHTTWPHQNQFGLAYVCCLECGREMPYSLEHMQIVGRYRKRNIWASRSAATAALIIAGTLLLLSPSYAVSQIAQPSADQCQIALAGNNIRPTCNTATADHIVRSQAGSSKPEWLAIKEAI